MDDALEIAEFEESPGAVQLLRILTCCRDTILPKFKIADSEVVRNREVYMLFARWAAWLGAGAVLFAILQLSGLNLALVGPALPWLEFGLALAAVAVALVGLGGRRQEKWFVSRFRAERLRLLKYEFLTRAALWSNDEQAVENCCAGLAAEVEKMLVSSYSTLQYWVTEGTVPQVLIPPAITEEAWRSLAGYYWGKRLAGQISYFAHAMERDTRRDEKTRTWPSILFFGSVAFVLAHFFVEVAGWHNGIGSDVLVEKAALLVAASLPVCGAGIRVVRGVLEYARNASRYASNHNVLVNLGERLRMAADSAAAFREIGFCEFVLEADHREWLRLMVEAEWFG